MHTVPIKSTCITETTSTLPPTTDSVNCDPHQLMGKVSYSIEKLDIILLQVINCKSKLDEIFRHLSDCGEQNVSVSIGIGSQNCTCRTIYYQQSNRDISRLSP